MKFNSYAEYVEMSKKYFSEKNLTIKPELMILPEEIFNHFGGVIEFGAGGKELVNKPKCGGKCNCEVKCESHKD